MNFVVSGVEVFPLWPFLMALGASFLCSMGGVSGAFLLLPYQVSVLGFHKPSVSATNLVFNIVAIPGGVLRFLREGRMQWPLTFLMVAGLVPGAALGVYVRLRYLPDPEAFQRFVGAVLLFIAAHLVYDVWRGRRHRAPVGPASGSEGMGAVRTTALGWRRFSYTFAGETYSFSPLAVLFLVTIVGTVGTTYGIGGGSIMAPLLVSVFRLPVYTIAGAALTSTFATSVIGVAAYTWLAPVMTPEAASAAPDWPLGILLGAGGILGIYLGARCQKHVPERWIKAMLAAVLLFLAVKYTAF